MTGQPKKISTAKQCSALRCPEGKTKYRASVSNTGFGGLSLEVRSDREAKSWVYRFRIGGGNQHEIILGVYPAMALAEARLKHREACELVSQGIDPRHHRAAMKADNQAMLTMQQLHERWIKHLSLTGEIKPETIQGHADRWRRHLEKSLGQIRLDHVQRPHLASALDLMRTKNREQTRKAMSTLNCMLDYAMVRGLVDENPMRLLRPKDFSATTKSGRSRWLSIPELRLLWDAIEQKGKSGQGIASTSVLSASVVGVIKLVILTGCRREEAVGMRWSEVDLEAGVWTLPAERAKNGNSHTIFLSPLAVALLRDMKSLHGRFPYVFASPRLSRGSEHPITAHCVSRALHRLQEAGSDTQPEGPLYQKMPLFTLHDLRRTCSSHWGEALEAHPKVVELMLNHLPTNKLELIYQRGKHLRLQKDTWLRWGELIEREVAGGSDRTARPIVLSVAA